MQGIVFIGGGNMATAIIGGLLAGGSAGADIRIVEPLPEARARLAERFPGLHVFAQVSAEAMESAEMVVLAVKPQQMREAALPLAPHLAHVKLVLSIAAGIRLVDLARWLGGYAMLVRAMPNTPSLVGAGVAGLFARDEVSQEAREQARRVLAATGDVVWCAREEDLDAVTGVSASGPAYVFYFLEGLERAALELGFPAADARRLAYATFAGAIKLAQASDAPPAELRAQVTSKGGTTERAIRELDASDAQQALVRAVKAATLRATEMGEQFGRDS